MSVTNIRQGDEAESEILRRDIIFIKADIERQRETAENAIARINHLEIELEIKEKELQEIVSENLKEFEKKEEESERA